MTRISLLRFLAGAFIVAAALLSSNTHAFSRAPATFRIGAATHGKFTVSPLKESSDNEDKSAVTQSLEEKMKKWEASEEEIRASTLGGVIPGSSGDDDAKRSDAFDIGLYIAFPFMVAGSLLFALFPFIMDKIDVSSVGPPPMV
uniref:Transmembrane protein n=1 Tax=Leptocylindrus danicus TaxID=163516 RepID=A0A7S2JSK3_9STRA|mmetsp:Transcript_11046/g.16705  ORF Transcript_11046/g.16705 Transcript_11046/m.16705 type:complete len:144 (+) Transcript_11046:117-548(+)|eukprot:CAMPEP_0116038754 /NCGR_PEP_ID=MMETSP0321-20121206/23044_1 /TAXON_ID=163516 /ORGANISM="Leptocylindrus danicus var. danicus, Strain B650" /LENGTH=143 /DNA_ID=CAMNT_0003517623 /DNA_START=113 /DNA_END=544 /DNA_ORIENTATION=+